MSSNALAGRRALVTGAAGFIGSHLVEALLAGGAEVTAFVHYNSTSNPGHLRHLVDSPPGRLDIVSGDITDPESVLNATRDAGVVFHLAALIGIPYSYQAPRSYLQTNIEGTLNVLEAVRACDVERMVLTSTSEVYGSALYVPIDENHPLQAQSPYAASKIGAEKLAESYYRSFDVPVVTLRPFNTYGPRQSARAVIPATIRQALWSDRVRLGATAPVRDMTFVTDTANAFIRAASTPGLEGGVYNLGSGEGHTIREIAATIMELAGRDDRIETDPERLRPAASEVDRLISNYEKFSVATGWNPSVPLRDGLARSMDWIREFGIPADAGTYAT